MDLVALRRELGEAARGTVRQLQRRRTRRQIHHADVLHVDALEEPGADRFGERFLGGEALGVSAGARVRALGCLGALNVREAAVLETLAVTNERGLDAVDVPQGGGDADAHRAAAISARMRRTAGSSPTNTASLMR